MDLKRPIHGSEAEIYLLLIGILQRLTLQFSFLSVSIHCAQIHTEDKVNDVVSVSIILSNVPSLCVLVSTTFVFVPSFNLD